MTTPDDLARLRAETTEALRKRLVPVSCTTVEGEPDGIHLSVYEWLPNLHEWATGPALCGQSADQGALPDDTPITCADCEGYRASYERALSRRPAAERERIAELEAEVARLARQRDQARALVRDMTDPGECWFDHHGYCQEHGWFDTDPACPHGRAKKLGLTDTPEENEK